MSKITIPSLIVAGLLSSTANAASMSVAAQQFAKYSSDCRMPGVCVADGNGNPVAIAKQTDIMWHPFTVNGREVTYEMFYLSNQLPVNLQLFYKDSRCQDLDHPYVAVGYPSADANGNFVPPITYDVPTRVWGDGFNLYGATTPSTVMTMGSWWSSWAAKDSNHGCTTAGISYAFAPATLMGSFKDWIPNFSIYNAPGLVTVGHW